MNKPIINRTKSEECKSRWLFYHEHKHEYKNELNWWNIKKKTDDLYIKNK